MVDIILKVLLIMLVLFAFALPGFILTKTGLVREDSLYSISNILLCFAQPLLIIKALAVDPIAPTGETLLNFLWVFLLSIAAIFLTFGASKLCFLFMKGEESGASGTSSCSSGPFPTARSSASTLSTCSRAATPRR